MASRQEVRWSPEPVPFWAGVIGREPPPATSHFRRSVMTTAQACVRGLLLAALLPEAPRWGRGLARFSPRFTDRQPASTAGATHFADSPQRWGVAPHGEHQVVEVAIYLLSPRLPSLRAE